MRDTKQVIVILRMAGMPRGKEIAQGSHASMAWLVSRVQRWPWWPVWFLLTRAERAWLRSGTTKIVCQVTSLAELKLIRDAAARAGLEWQMITDMGRTVFHGQPTVTALAVGPDWTDKIDPVCSQLRLY